MDGYFDGPVWDVLLVIAGAILGLVLQRLDFGPSAHKPPPPPLRLSDLAAATPRAPRTNVAAAPRRRKAQEADDDVWAWLLGAVIAAFALAAFYLEAREEIAAVLRALVLLGLGFWVVTYVVLLRRGAIVGFDWTLATAVAAIVFLLAPLVTSLLASPEYVVGRSYDDLLTSYDACGIAGLSDFDGVRGATFVLFQLIGVLLYVIAWAAAFTVLLVCLAVNAVRLDARPRRLWSAFARVPGPWRDHPVGVTFAALAVAVISLAPSGGAAQRAFGQLPSLDHQPVLSQVRAQEEDGTVRLVVRSDFPARVTIRVRRSGKTVRTLRRDAAEGLNRWSFARADGRPLSRANYSLRLTARDSEGAAATPVTVRVPGRYAVVTPCQQDSGPN